MRRSLRVSPNSVDNAARAFAQKMVPSFHVADGICLPGPVGDPRTVDCIGDAGWGSVSTGSCRSVRYDHRAAHVQLPAAGWRSVADGRKHIPHPARPKGELRHVCRAVIDSGRSDAPGGRCPGTSGVAPNPPYGRARTISRHPGAGNRVPDVRGASGRGNLGGIDRSLAVESERGHAALECAVTPGVNVDIDIDSDGAAVHPPTREDRSQPGRGGHLRGNSAPRNRGG